MKPKFFLAAGVVLMLAFVLVLGTAAAQPASMCDPAYVNKTNNIIHVRPTSADDTTNIQCAFDWAIATGPHKTIHLLPGTFHTGQIYVKDFIGAFRGSGMQRTTIVNLPNLYVKPDSGIPSPDNPQPYLFAMFGGDYTFSHMTIKAVGEKPTTYWSWPGCENNYTFHALIGMFPYETHAKIFRVAMIGEPYATAHYGYNVMQGIFALGILGAEMPPISGSIRVSHSSFEGAAYSLAFLNMADATIVVSNNDFTDTSAAAEAADLVNTRVIFGNNRVEASMLGLTFANYILPADVNSDHIVRNNVIKAPIGVAMYQTMDADSTCLIAFNNMSWVTDTPIFLSPGAQACVLKANRE